MPMSRRNFLVLSGATAGFSMAQTAPTAGAAPAAAPPEVIGAPRQRLDGPAKVSGTAPYAFEHEVEAPTYLFPVQSTIVRGKVTAIDTSAAESLDGVLTVLTHHNAPRLSDTEDAELSVLQTAEVSFRGQYVAAVIAESQEIARHAAGLVRVEYEEYQHETELPDHGGGELTSNVTIGDVDAALSAAPVTIDHTYTTPQQHNNPMEPHTTVAQWTRHGLRLYDSTQGAHPVRQTIAPIFGLEQAQVEVIAPHVGGGFGSKGLPHAPLVLAALAAQRSGGRPVKYAVSRQQMFPLVGYRTPTRQRLRLAANRDGQLTAISHESVEQTARIKEFNEGSAGSAGMLYAAENRRVTNRLVPLDVPATTWMRAPGKCPGVHAMEVAMDEMAEACGLDPIEFRVRNEPEVDPESGKPFSSRNLVACLREGARRFGWDDRGPVGSRREDGWYVGMGVAASTYPTIMMPGSVARIRYQSGKYQVMIGAADIGTGTWTALAQIAADALEVPFEAVEPHIGSTVFPNATVAGGSTGIASWGSAIMAAARAFRNEHGRRPPEGAEAEGTAERDPEAKKFSMHAFGAQFAEVRVHEDTGEIRVPRMLGVFAAGRIVNARTARSQLIGGMTMGLSMALHELGYFDTRTGHVVNHDFAEYHVAANADVGTVDAVWLDEEDPHVNPLGTKGIGEIGIVGTAASIVNAAYHATGIRVRDLPMTPDDFLR